MLIKMSREKVEKCCVDTIICSFMHNNYNRQQSNCCSARLINTHRHKRTYINAEVLSMLWALLCILCCFYVAACCCCMLLLSVAGAVPRTNHGQQCFHITQKQQHTTTPTASAKAFPQFNSNKCACRMFAACAFVQHFGATCFAGSALAKFAWIFFTCFRF